MATNKLSYALELDTGDAGRALRDFGRDADQGFDDAESAAAQFARALEAQVEAAKAEIDETRRSVDALERALGEAASGVDVNGVVADMRRIGLTAEDIEQDAEELARALKRVDEVDIHAANAGFNNVGEAVRRVDGDIGRARDTMTGFVGGAVGELPVVGEAFGPAGEALGQLTEGLIEGDVKAGQLVKSLGLMTGVAGGVLLVSAAVSSIQESRAFERERVDTFTDALIEAGGELSGIADQIENTREILVREGGFMGLFEQTRDLLPLMGDLGITLRDVQEAAAAGDIEQLSRSIEAQREEVRLAAEAAGYGTTEYNRLRIEYNQFGRVLEALPQVYEQVAAATEKASGTNAFLSETLDDATEATGEYQDAVAEMSPEVENYAESIADARQELEDKAEAEREAEEAVRDHMDATSEAASSQIGFRADVNRARDAVRELDEVLGDSESTTRDVQEATDEAALAAMRMAESAVQLATDQAEARGATLGAEDAARIQLEALRELRDTLDPGSPLRQWLNGYIGDLNRVPTDVSTNVRIAAPGQSVDRGGRQFSHTGSRFGAGDTREILPGQAFIPDSPVFTAPTSGRMLSQSETAGMGGGGSGGVTVQIGSVLGMPSDALVDTIARSMRFAMRGSAG